ncbi:MAG: YfgM family protein [Longimicrobiales bacterium]
MAKYRKPGSRPKKVPDAVDQEDAFVAKAFEVTSWAQRNRRAATLGIGALAIGVAAFLYYGNYKNTLGQQAAAQLEQLQRRLDAGDPTGVQEDLQVFLQRFGGTPFAGEARLSLGQVTAEMGDPEGAAEVLEPAARDVDEPLGAQAAALLAAIYEDSGNLAAAEGLYMRLADRAELGFQVRDALADAARLRVQQGDAAGAVALYDRLLGEMAEDDPTRGVVEMRRAELSPS